MDQVYSWSGEIPQTMKCGKKKKDEQGGEKKKQKTLVKQR